MPVATMARFSSVILSHMSSVSVCVCVHARMYAYPVCVRACRYVGTCVLVVLTCVCVCVY